MIVCQSCRTENADDASKCVSCGEAPTLAPRPKSADPAATATGFTFPGAMGVTAPAAPPGTRIANRYELVALLGRGGMGLVYRARDLVLNEETAIKLLQPHLMREVGDLERLKREITTARRITHPNVIRIHEFGLAGDEGYISMEILTGGTLHERLQKGSIPIPEAIEIALGIADGLGAAHKENVVHRDIKPHNVLFDASGSPKLADFGLARLASATSQTMGFSGTPQYMSPELADGREITPRSDVYSAGILFYELFAGKPPFQADSLLRLANLHSKEPPPPLRAKRPDVPHGVELIVMRALEKDPARRYADGRALAAAIRDFKAGATVQLPPPPRRMPWLAVGAALFVLCALAWAFRDAIFPRPVAATPTAIAVVTATVTATPTPATPTPAPAKTATPPAAKTPPKTPRPTPTEVAVLSTPAPARGPAFLSIRAIPWAAPSLDGKKVAVETPVSGIEVTPGEHTISLTTPDIGTCTHTLTLRAGERRVVAVDMHHCKVTVSEPKSDKD